VISPASADLRSAPPEGLRPSIVPTCAPLDSIDSISSATPTFETIAPADAAALAAVVRAAFEREQAVYPVGGGSSLKDGLPCMKPGIALSLANLNRVLEHPADDLTVTVEAGITLADLNRHLAEKRQWLPLDPPEPEKATIGGIVAANACGPRRHGCGTVGDYLVGFRAIDGRGEAFSGGGKVVKNAAGYNLSRLMIGALGTLGVIAEATLIVRPLPTYSALLIRDVPSFEQAEALLDGLGRSQAAPTIVELLAGPARPNCPLPAMPDKAAARLVVGFEGSQIDVRAMLAALVDEWKLSDADGVTSIAGAGVASIASWLGASPAMLQVNVLPSRLVGLMEQLARMLPGHPLQAHASSGEVRAYASDDDGAAFPNEFVDLVRNTLRPLAIAAGGHLTVLAAPEEATLTLADIWGPLRPGAALMRAIRQRFDPAGILNPGRFPF
jgi:glycolate oxidase FAD binding subunit